MRNIRFGRAAQLVNGWLIPIRQDEKNQFRPVQWFKNSSKVHNVLSSSHYRIASIWRLPAEEGMGPELGNGDESLLNDGEQIRRKRRRVSDQEEKKFTEKGSVHAYRMMQESA